jgi:hypothetical protein
MEPTNPYESPQSEAEAIRMNALSVGGIFSMLFACISAMAFIAIPYLHYQKMRDYLVPVVTTCIISFIISVCLLAFFRKYAVVTGTLLVLVFFAFFFLLPYVIVNPN